jgi:DeoR/GlpR family transcriptional regulator of sugar metabolism
VEQPLPPERHARILEVLAERHAVRVSTLSELLGVSEVTIRRDLEDLERKGLLERTHGGAIPAQRMRAEPAYGEAAASMLEEKRAIGRAAAALVQPGDTVFLNGGTTTLEVFRALESKARDITIVTNHVAIAQESAERASSVILIGGEYRLPSNSCVGSFATDAIRKVFAGRALLGIEGVSLRAGVTSPVAAEADIARVMIEQTHGPVTLVADHTKIGTVADFAVAPITAVAELITDVGMDPDYRDDLGRLGLNVVIAETVGVPRGG